MTKISNQYSLTNILTADLANSRLGINNVSPAYSLDLTGTARVSTSAYFATASGSVGIGTASPSDKLNIVVGANGNVARFDGPTSGLIFQTNASTTDIISYGGSTPAYRALNFSTGASTNLTITTAGNVGIGTTSPTGKFAVNTGASNQIAFFNNSSSGGLYNIISLNGSYSEGTNMSIQGGGVGDANLYVNSGYTSSTSGAIVFRTGSATVYTERMLITSGGDFLWKKSGSTVSGIGLWMQSANADIYSSIANGTNTYHVYDTTNSAYRFYVTGGGTINATNPVISAISDQRLKENITDLEIGLNAIMALRPRKFDWKEKSGNTGKNLRGFIAQEFEQVFPDLIDKSINLAPEGEEAYKQIRVDLMPVLVKAIQELSLEINLLKNK
jgi:hypothetical protein